MMNNNPLVTALKSVTDVSKLVYDAHRKAFYFTTCPIICATALHKLKVHSGAIEVALPPEFWDEGLRYKIIPLPKTDEELTQSMEDLYNENLDFVAKAFQDKLAKIVKIQSTFAKKKRQDVSVGTTITKNPLTGVCIPQFVGEKFSEKSIQTIWLAREDLFLPVLSSDRDRDDIPPHDIQRYRVFIERTPDGKIHLCYRKNDGELVNTVVPCSGSMATLQTHLARIKREVFGLDINNNEKETSK